MSSQTWVRGPICGVDNCRSRLYRLSAGRKFCQFGHVMEGNLEIDDDDGEAYVQTRRLNILISDTGFGSNASRLSTPAAAEKKTRLYGASGRVHHYKCLQYILKKLIGPIAGHLCPGNTAFEQNLRAAVKLQWVQWVRATFSTGGLLLMDLYVLVFMAMRKMNQHPAYIDQYIHMLKHSKVPFFNAVALLPAHMTALMPVLSSMKLSIHAAPVEDLFYRYVLRWAYRLGSPADWVLPLDYFYPQVFRLYTDLRLPDAPHLLLVFHKLAHDATGGQLDIVASKSVFHLFPDARVVGFMFVVLRLYLIGAPRVVDTAEWVKWMASARLLPLYDEMYQKMDMHTLLGLSELQINEYCDWIHGAFITDEAVEDLPHMKRRLRKIFDFQKSESKEEPALTTAPIAVVKNTLSKADRSNVEAHLVRYFCSRFGLREQSLLDLIRRAEKAIYKTLKEKNILGHREHGVHA